MLPLLASLPLLSAGAAVGRWLAGIGLRLGSDLAEMATGSTTLKDIGTRRAFVHIARSVIDISGQRVSAIDKLYLAEAVATLLMGASRIRSSRPDKGSRDPGARADAGKPT